MGIEITSETGEVVVVQDPAATVHVSDQSPTVEISQAPAPATVSIAQPVTDVVAVAPAEQNVVEVTNLRGPPGLDGADGIDGTDGTDGVDGVDGADGVVQSLVEGSGIHVDDTDPAHPVISATGGGGGGAADSVTLVRTAGETLSGHRGVTPDVTGALFYADPDTIGNQPVWVTTGAIDVGDSGEVVALGNVTEPSWNWAPGNIYLAANGFLTQTEPTSGALVIVALATTPTSIFVDRYPTIDL